MTRGAPVVHMAPAIDEAAAEVLADRVRTVVRGIPTGRHRGPYRLARRQATRRPGAAPAAEWAADRTPGKLAARDARGGNARRFGWLDGGAPVEGPWREAAAGR